MKLLRTFIVTTVILALGIFVFACSDDDDMKPLSIKDWDGKTINVLLYSLVEPNYYILELQGGDGNYTVESSNTDVISTEVSSKELKLKVMNIGSAVLTISDNSQNKLEVNISSDYYTDNLIVKLHDIVINGDDLTENEKKAIREKELAEMPVKVGGGYKLIYTDKNNKKGKAIIYSDVFGEKGVETTFSMIESKEGEIPRYVGYEIIINNEKRTFIVEVYKYKTKKELIVTRALAEDITKKVQKEYPKAELVYTQQVIK